MPEWLAGRPFGIAVLILFLIGVARGQATYGLGRWAASLTVRPQSEGWKARLHDRVNGAEAMRGRLLLARWGLPLIPLCYLTIGLQTLILLAAGLLRVSWAKFTLVQVPGALAWALIYSTVGFAAWEAFAGYPVTAAIIVAAVALVVLVRRRRRPATAPGQSFASDHLAMTDVSETKRTGA